MTPFGNVMPFSSLLAGAAAGVIGVHWYLAICGAGCVLGEWYFLHQLPRLRELVRPIYIQLGILPEAIRAMNTASELSLQEKQ